MSNSPQKSASDNRICVGIVTGPHGLKGDVKLKSYPENPKDVAAFGPVTDKSGERQFDIRILSANQKGLVVELSGVRGREAAEAIRGTELYMVRDLLPELEEDEFYYSDLVGLVVEDINGAAIGTVSLVDNYGAGEIIEVDLKDGGTEMYPMSREVVPTIDLKNGRVVINPPAEIFADADHDKEEAE